MGSTNELLDRYRKGSRATVSPQQPEVPAEAEALEGPTPVSDELKELFGTEASLGLAELDEYWGDFKKLTSVPKAGSVLYVLKHHKVGAKEMQTFFADVYLKRLGPLIIDPDVDLHAYILYSLVVPHATAVDIAESVRRAAAADNSPGLWPVLSSMTGHDMSHRGDVANLLRVVLRRYPKIIEFLVPTKTIFKSK